MVTPPLNKILKNIKHVFVNEDLYGFDKHLWEYKPQSKFLGDVVIFSMAEATNPPTFYFVISPYDEASKKAPQQALIFKNGKLIFDEDYTNLAAMRTGAMDTLVLQVLGITNLTDKQILMFGRGKTATWSQQFLDHSYPNHPNITFVHTETPKGSFDISQFDIIICHTNTKEFLLSANDRNKIKPGAIITNYISQELNTEVAPSFFNFDEANVVIDWKPNLARTSEIKPDDRLVQFKNLLNGSQILDDKKKYSIFRFIGTPLQNLAVLKALVHN